MFRRTSEKGPTETAFFSQKVVIINIAENKQLTLAIYVDFSDDFDFDDRGIFLQNLHCYAIRGSPLHLGRTWRAIAIYEE